jgi:hypothetical protein
MVIARHSQQEVEGVSLFDHLTDPQFISEQKHKIWMVIVSKFADIKLGYHNNVVNEYIIVTT